MNPQKEYWQINTERIAQEILLGTLQVAEEDIKMC